MSYERGGDWSNPSTEMIKNVRLPEYGNLSLEEIRQQRRVFDELEAAARLSAQQVVAQQRGDRVTDLARFLASQNGSQTTTPTKGNGVPYVERTPVAQQPYVPPATVEQQYHDDALYTQGMEIVFASDDDRRLYEASKRHELADVDQAQVSTASQSVKRHKVGPNGEIITLEPTVSSAEVQSAAVRVEKRPRFTRKRAVQLGAAATALLAGGAAVWQTGAFGFRGGADANIAGGGHIDNAAVLPLSQVEATLLESYDACFDESGRGTPVIQAEVSAVVPSTWPYTDPSGKLLSLGAIVGGQQVKPVVKLMPMQGNEAGATIGVSACVVEANKEAAIVSDDATRTVTIDLAKVSPQLQEGVYGSLAGFLRKDEDTSVTKTDAVIDQLLTNKGIADAEAKRLKAAYADEPNKKAERDQAVRKTSETIAKEGSVYANRIKATLGVRITALVRTQIDSLRKQGMIGDAPVEVKTINTAQGISVKGAAPAKADAFTLADSDPAKIVTFNIVAEDK